MQNVLLYMVYCRLYMKCGFSPATRSFSKGYYILYAVCHVNGIGYLLKSLLNIVRAGPNNNDCKK